MTIRRAINENICFGGLKDVRDPPDPTMTKFSSSKEIKKKLPIYHVKSLSKINFDNVPVEASLLEAENGLLEDVLSYKS